MMSVRTIAAAAVMAVGALSIVPHEAAATTVTLDFYKITNNGADASSQLFVDVSDDGDPAGAWFKFYAVAGVNTSFSISSIYFSDTGGLFNPPPVEIDKTPGVNYTVVAGPGVPSPPDLPGGNSATPPFSVTSGLFADANNPAPQNGVNVGEFYTVQLNYGALGSFSALLSDLESGAFRIGLHVISHSTNGGSESYINNPPGNGPAPIPLPAAGWLLLGGLGALAAVRRRRKAA